MKDLPIFLSIFIILITIATVALFYKASNRSKITLWVISCWLIVQSAISITGFYTIANTIPPRFALLLLLPVLFIISLFFIPAGKKYIDNMNPRTLTLLHVVRIPVEMAIFWLAIHKTLPSLMSFEGRNFDVFSGVTAPIIYYVVFIKNLAGKKALLAWNLICLALLANIVVLAVLSAPFPFQQLAFDQPNIAVLYFPFTLLPCCIVPIVLFAHLASIRQLVKSEKNRSIYI